MGVRCRSGQLSCLDGSALPQRTAIVSGWKCADVRGTQGVMEMLLSLLLSTAAGNFTEKHRQQQRR